MSIANINIDKRDRDDISQILQAIQIIYKTPELSNLVCRTLDKIVTNSQQDWAVLILGTLSLDLNLDASRLQNLANNHRMVRQFLGHNDDFSYQYSLESIKRHVSLFTPEILESINQSILQSGYISLQNRRKRTIAWSFRLLAKIAY
mgnify:CR=1 FL=1